MLKVLRDWFERYFSDPQAILLAVLLIVGLSIVLTLGYILAPVLAALVLAYLMQGMVSRLQDFRIPHPIAVGVVFVLFLTLLFLTLLVLMPLLSAQLTQFFQEVPSMINSVRQLSLQLPEKYPGLITAQQIDDVSLRMRSEIGSLGQSLVSLSLASIPGLITLAVYLILLPLLVFFFLKDADAIIAWFAGLLPKERSLPTQVWAEMDVQIGNYVRGKFWEIVIVGGVSYMTFVLMKLDYAPLLAVLVGLSVIIPYIGATVVTFPVALVALLQWGPSEQFGWLLLAYGIIQALDGNVLVPLLFSEAVNLHPVAIIVAVLFFGGIWGFWGIFFAIPLATLVKVLLVIWPRRSDTEEVL